MRFELTSLILETCYTNKVTKASSIGIVQISHIAISFFFSIFSTLLYFAFYTSSMIIFQAYGMLVQILPEDYAFFSIHTAYLMIIK